jgi:DNA replication and repair protein RecF
MIVTRLHLQHFRNHADRQITWSPRLNIITGPNGAGKTNLIDAIHYLCMSRSFVATSDQYVVQSGEKSFHITGMFEGSIRTRPFEIRCEYSRGDGKKIFVNDSPLDRLSELIGRVPVVVLSPDDKRLTSEGPSERRAFLDSFVSQLSAVYLRDLIDYRRILRQRNAVLSDQRTSRSMMEALLEPWNEQLARTGSSIIHRRHQTLLLFDQFLQEQYDTIAGIGHRPSFVYKTITDSVADTPEELYTLFLEQVHTAFDRERERQQTTVGPHRDDIIFYLDDMELRKFGSQGQHRLFALALKLAQRAYYESELEDLPILLLDDVFGDLDPVKTSVLMHSLLAREGQTFITAANRSLFGDTLPFEQDKDQFYSLY